MIEYIEGDIFESPAQVIVNTVNTVGVMGKGLALSFKKRYPDMFERYKSVCEKGLLTTGKLMLFYEADYWILLFPTKEHWRNPSKLAYIESGLQKFVQTYAQKGITSIAFPRLGCGNGELKWEEVRPIMEKYLKDLPIAVYIYLGTHPDAEPEHKTPKKTIDWLKRHAKDMSFTGMKDDLVQSCSILPYEFEYNGHRYQMCYQNDMFMFTTGTKETKVSTDRLYSIWDALRSSSIVCISQANAEETMIYALLHSSGYLSKIRLQTPNEQMKDGYQLNAGIRRISSFSNN